MRSGPTKEDSLEVVGCRVQPKQDQRTDHDDNTVRLLVVRVGRCGGS